MSSQLLWHYQMLDYHFWMSNQLFCSFYFQVLWHAECELNEMMNIIVEPKMPVQYTGTVWLSFCTNKANFFALVQNF